MRIVMICCDYAPNVGGIAAHIQQLSWALSRRGHHVWVLNHRYGRGEERTWEEHGVRVHQSFLGRENNRIKSTLPSYWYSGRRRLVKVLHESDSMTRGAPPDGRLVMHVHDLLEGLGLALFTPRRNSPLVLTNHSSTYLSWLRSAFKMNLLRLVARPVTAVIAPSRELQEATARIRKAAVYIPNGVDPGTFSPADEALRSAARQRLGLSASQVILCPRRLVYKNGVDRLIEALPRIVERAPNAHAILAGGGPEHEALAARASSLGVVNRISFLGNVPHTGMSDLYAASDVVTIPSRLEATSLAALEAAACGLPVVATRVGGLPEVVQDSHTGYLVAEDDSTGLADAISRLLIDTSLSHRLGTRARSVVLHKFSWDEIARQTEEVYSLAADRR